MMAAMKVKELEAEILRLAPKDQAYLFDKLLHVLDGEEIEPERPGADFPDAKSAGRRKKTSRLRPAP